MKQTTCKIICIDSSGEEVVVEYEAVAEGTINWIRLERDVAEGNRDGRLWAHRQNEPIGTWRILDYQQKAKEWREIAEKLRNCVVRSTEYEVEIPAYREAVQQYKETLAKYGDK